eukprot:jgi/Chrzof1/13483/UNPLg00570.t1
MCEDQAENYEGAVAAMCEVQVEEDEEAVALCEVVVKGKVDADAAKGSKSRRSSNKLRGLKRAIAAAWKSTHTKSKQLMAAFSFVKRPAVAPKAAVAEVQQGVSCGCFGFK